VPETRFASLLIVSVGLLLALGRWLQVPHSVMLTLGGLLSTLVPGIIPPVQVPPQAILGLMLPPLLYAGASALSVELLRFALLRGVLAGMAQTVLLALLAAAVAGLVLPGLDTVGCLLVGIAASVGDTRLLQETGQDRHLPRALMDGFAGQRIGAPVVTVTLFTMLAAAVGQSPPGAGEAAWRFAVNLVGGGALGVGLGLAMAEFRRRTGPATVDVALSLATPYAAALLAGAVGLSVPAVVIAAALALAWASVDRDTGEAISSAEARLLERNVWTQLGTLLSAVLFFLVGRALPDALDGLDQAPWRVAAIALALVLLAPLLQATLTWAALHLPGTPPIPGQDGLPAPRWRAALTAGLSGGRSVIALAIVLGVPATVPASGEPYAGRDLVLAVAALLVLLSVLLQWALLPRLVAWAGLGGGAEEERERDLAHRAATHAQDEAGAPEDGAARGRKALADLRARDAIGDEARAAAEEAVEVRARAEETRQAG
jgi:NhaP-type Na+/H+ or K+/H+ antiporter